MRVVIDTNVLLMSIPKISKYRRIFDKLISGDITLLITNEILSEYLEIIEKKTTHEIAINFAELLLKLPNVEKVEVYYKWSLISADNDDNKFCDCAISAGAKFLVSNDKHFDVLKSNLFPPIELKSALAFLDEIGDK